MKAEVGLSGARPAQRPPIEGMRVGRPWRQRIEDLFACEVDHAGKSVLDAGSNVGILAYEISKRGPSFLHLVDGSAPQLEAARLIFSAVETPHRLDLVDLTDEERLKQVLAPAYDIVQLLAVYQHIHRASGDEAARRVLASLAAHCSETFIVASNPDFVPAMTETLLASGLSFERETVSPSPRRVRHLVFRRQ